MTVIRIYIYFYTSVCPAVPPDIVYGGDTSADLAVTEGDNATLSCRATGRPPPRVSWKREDGEPIVIRTTSIGRERLSINLKFQFFAPSLRADRGNRSRVNDGNRTTGVLTVLLP